MKKYVIIYTEDGIEKQFIVEEEVGYKALDIFRKKILDGHDNIEFKRIYIL